MNSRDYNLSASTMRLILRLIFVLAVAMMIALTFLWPILINDDPADPTLRVLSLGAFGAYLLATIGLLSYRIRQSRMSGSS